MNSRSPLTLIGLLTGLVVFGTVGYRLIEGWSWLDCLFMTAMTLTTVGYGSPGRLHTDGKVFSVLLMLFGIGLMLYLLTLLAEVMLRTVMNPLAAQRRKERKIMNLKNHTIVCGYGQVGEAVATALKSANKDVVVVDQRTEHLEWAALHGLQTVVGDATDEDILRRAGVERASALVSVINSDPSNLYVVLSAKGLNPNLRVIARASDESAARKMRRAGADEVVNPYQVSGNRIAALMLAPHLANLLSGNVSSEHFTVREIGVPDSLVGKTIADLGRSTGALIVAVWRDGHPVRARAKEVLQMGDTVLVAGAAAEVEAVEATRAAADLPGG